MPTLALLAALLLVGPAPAEVPPTAHDPHVTYSDMAVEGSTIVCRIRFFQDDLELALSLHRGRERVHLGATPAIDALFLDYLGEHLHLEADGTALTPTILASGDDVMDREPAWWYTLRFDASAPVSALAVRNDAMFELFDDQQHILKVIRFPDETERSYTLLPDEDEVTVTF